MDLSKDIQSLSNFKRNTSDLVERMEESGNPMVLTVNGKAKLVVQDAVSYQKLLDRLDEAQAFQGIRRGLRTAFADIRRKRHIPLKAKA